MKTKRDLEKLIVILAKGINKSTAKSPDKYLEKMFRAYKILQNEYEERYGAEYTWNRTYVLKSFSEKMRQMQRRF